jgi:hypothetical protein
VSRLEKGKGPQLYSVLGISERALILRRRYLKGFPIKEMAPVLDYIVYMTYDLHGQWDYGNQFSTEGCEAGNCLRSQ